MRKEIKKQDAQAYRKYLICIKYLILSCFLGMLANFYGYFVILMPIFLLIIIPTRRARNSMRTTVRTTAYNPENAAIALGGILLMINIIMIQIVFKLALEIQNILLFIVHTIVLLIWFRISFMFFRIHKMYENDEKKEIK